MLATVEPILTPLPEVVVFYAEIKVLRNGKLVRTAQFTVAANGQITDNGWATQNQLGLPILLLPVKVLGDQDGMWDAAAWKTDAFYGNPLTGFNIP